MSQQLINRSPDLKRLRDEGFNLRVRGGFLLVAAVPYVNSQKEVKHGTLVTKLTLAGERTARPEDHVLYFAGEYPCDEKGNEIGRIRNGSNRHELLTGVIVDYSFSAKPKPSDFYEDYHAKVTTYVAILSGPAREIERGATAQTFAPVAPDEDENSVFHYIDTASSRAEIDLLTDRLAKGKVAIVGLGGTGSYVLDFVAKTPVPEIHLFDHDDYLQHNAFRSPGAPSIEELEEKPKKVAYFQARYSKMHRGIVAHDAYVDADNAEQLREMSFVFLCLDRGTAKKLIIAKLEEFGIPFVDVGMGLYVGDEGLGGTLRTTISTPATRELARARIPSSDGDRHNEYALNIQVADLNALNAAHAVIKWKQHLGFYANCENEFSSTYTVELNQLFNEGEPE